MQLKSFRTMQLLCARHTAILLFSLSSVHCGPWETYAALLVSVPGSPGKEAEFSWWEGKGKHPRGSALLEEDPGPKVQSSTCGLWLTLSAF